MGVAFLFGKNQIRVAHRATLPSPLLLDGRGGRLRQMWKGIKGIAAGVRWLLLFELIKRGRLKFINPSFQTTSLPYQQPCSFPRLAGEG